ncbi:MAG: hypothetical protein FJ012_01220 [Chloroflexi bacterium]|nr:hypothetical protein [Chloroflexota bacterium]
MKSVPVTTLRAYLLLDIQEGKLKEAARVLRNKPGVVAVDIVEVPPDVVAVVEAPERLELAETTLQVLESVENLVDCVSLLPVQGDI